MDTKRFAIVVLLTFLLLLGWQPLMFWVGRQLGYDMTRRPATQPTTQVAPAMPENIAATTNAATTTSATAGGGWRVRPAAESPAIALGAQAKHEPKADSPFAIRLELSPLGAGLERVHLVDYKRELEKDEPYSYEHVVDAEQLRPLATTQVIIDGTPVSLVGAAWTNEGTASSGSGRSEAVVSTWSLLLERGGQPALKLVKRYSVSGRDVGKASSGAGPLGFEVAIANQFENLTDQPMSVELALASPTPPTSETERYDDVYYLAGLRHPKGQVYLEPHAASSLEQTTLDLAANDDESKLVWVGVTTTYFNAIVRGAHQPGERAPAIFRSAEGRALHPELRGLARQTTVAMRLNPVTVSAKQSADVNLLVYLGPRKREYLKNDYYAAPGLSLDQALVIAIGPCSFCTFQWLISVLFAVLKTFYWLTRDWGLAIIGLVVVVRLLLHPITKKSQLSMLRWGKMAPEMERIKKKFADNQAEQQKALMQFTREHGATPVAGCLPMFLQMPIWIALWQAMLTTFELRHAPFLYGFTWIHDLSKPDHLIDFARWGWKPIHLPLYITISGLNVLPLAFGVLQYIQMKIQPKPATLTPEQEQQQKIMQWMILFMFPLMLYGSPSGLCIYMITSFLIGIWESKRVKRLFEQEEAEKDRFRVVEGEPVRANVKRVDSKPRGLAGWLAELQNRAEQMKGEAEKRSRKKK